MQEVVYSTGRETSQLVKAILIYTKRGLIKDRKIFCFLVFQVSCVPFKQVMRRQWILWKITMRCEVHCLKDIIKSCAKIQCTRKTEIKILHTWPNLHVFEHPIGKINMFCNYWHLCIKFIDQVTEGVFQLHTVSKTECHSLSSSHRKRQAWLWAVGKPMFYGYMVKTSYQSTNYSVNSRVMLAVGQPVSPLQAI